MTTTTANPQPCQARTKKGRQCSAYAVAGSVYCFAHDPDLRETRTAARRSGGQARHGRNLKPGPGEPIRLESVGDILKTLEQAINDCLSLENSLSRAGTIARVCGVALKAFEISELEQRLAALEERLSR